MDFFRTTDVQVIVETIERFGGKEEKGSGVQNVHSFMVVVLKLYMSIFPLL